jgi:hypothetical protein
MFKEHKGLDHVYVTVKVNGKGKFPVEVEFRSGGSSELCTGRSNHKIICGRGDDDDGDD